MVKGYHHILMQSGGAMQNTDPADRTATSWQQFQGSKFWKDWKWEVTMVGEVQEIVAAITDRTALAVSDRSYKEGRGAAAWTIKGCLAKDKITGACLVPGTTEDHSTFRSEAMGILGTLLMLHYLLGEDGLVVGILPFSCDGKLALNRAASSQPIGITEPHADILSAILNVRKRIPFKISFKHMRGHQDTGYAMVLEWDTMLNVEMDQWAKDKL